MDRIAIAFLVAVSMTSGFSLKAQADSATNANGKLTNATSHLKPMHPHQLTLYPHGRPQRRHSAYSYTRHPFSQPTPIHNTFMGSRY